jgi:hypothetical protein
VGTPGSHLTLKGRDGRHFRVIVALLSFEFHPFRVKKRLRWESAEDFVLGRTILPLRGSSRTQGHLNLKEMRCVYGAC